MRREFEDLNLTFSIGGQVFFSQINKSINQSISHHNNSYISHLSRFSK